MLDDPNAPPLPGTELAGSLATKVVSDCVQGQETKISYFRNSRNFCRMLLELGGKTLNSSPTSGFSFPPATEETEFAGVGAPKVVTEGILVWGTRISIWLSETPLT
ncbi:hypothetical protein TNCV_1915981 [Trichonephila clavipes]|uniref:Uncharacterized protein n=1 Tax=Trichonephila clavipes TaxID=2585209 RepID=A0A8X7BBN8_TRICX|nr:hypothetical protein TNCV_1915981 [Trichonephila clavipes]